MECILQGSARHYKWFSCGKGRRGSKWCGRSLESGHYRGDANRAARLLTVARASCQCDWDWLVYAHQQTPKKMIMKISEYSVTNLKI